MRNLIFISMLLLTGCAVRKPVVVKLTPCVENQYSLTALNGNDSGASDMCTSSGGMVNLALSNSPLTAITVGASSLQKGTKITKGTSVQ